MAEVMTVTEAGRLLADGLDEVAVGPFADRAVLVVDLDEPHEPAALTRLQELLRDRPCVTVGVSSSPAELPEPPTFDVLLAATVRAPRPWVATCGDVTGHVDQLVDAVDASPAASVALVQLLRAGEALGVVDAVVAESWVYGLLQGGPDHRRWLARRAERVPRSDAPGPVVRVGARRAPPRPRPRPAPGPQRLQRPGARRAGRRACSWRRSTRASTRSTCGARGRRSAPGATSTSSGRSRTRSPPTCCAPPATPGPGWPDWPTG